MRNVADSDTFVVGLVGEVEEHGGDAAAVVDTYVVMERAALAQARIVDVQTLVSLVGYYALAVNIVGP